MGKPYFLDSDLNHDIRDRFLINKYPTTIYISADNRMYYYKGDYIS